jgi:hypothetical protein
MITSSKDGTLKFFHSLNSSQSSISHFKIDRALNETKNLFQISYMNFGTWSDDSP